VAAEAESRRGDAAPLAADEIRSVVGTPGSLVIEKELDRLDAHVQAFIAHSPLVVIASADADGRCDASPRGDPPGFVRVLDERTLLIPDRKGNRRADTMLNIAANAHVGLLFYVPGSRETVRVNGRAEVTDDDALLEPSAMQGKPPKLGIVVHVDEVFFHCARSSVRAGLWEPSRWPDASGLATLGKVLSDQVCSTELDADELDEGLEQSNRDLY